MILNVTLEDEALEREEEEEEREESTSQPYKDGQAITSNSHGSCRDEFSAIRMPRN